MTTALTNNPLRAALAILTAARDCDLIHCHTGRAHSFAVGLAWLHRRPIVATRRVMFEPKRTWFTRYKYRAVAKIVCISQSIKTQLVRWGVSVGQLTVVPDAVPEVHKVLEVLALRTRLAVPSDRRIVGCIGALTAEKDHATLLRAARELRSKASPVHFVVIGDGPLKGDLLRLRHELGLDETVQFTGFIPEAQALLGAFDAFVLCSRSEGLGSIILDAFAAGVPVIATSVGGISELVADGVTGLLVPAGDSLMLAASIERLLSDHALRDRIIAAARAMVQQEFTVQRMAERYVGIYEEALRGS